VIKSPGARIALIDAQCLNGSRVGIPVGAVKIAHRGDAGILYRPCHPRDVPRFSLFPSLPVSWPYIRVGLVHFIVVGMLSSVRHQIQRTYQQCRRPSLRMVLTVPFLLQTIVVVGFIGFVSFRNGQRAVDNLIQDLSTEINDRVQEKLRNYVDVPHNLNRINADIMTQELLDPTDLAAVETYFLARRRQFDQLTFIGVALRNGNYIGLGYRQQGGLTLGILDRSVGDSTRLWHVTPDGHRLQELEPLPDFDPRERAWYRIAVEAGRSFWTAPFFAFDTGELLLSAAERIYDRNGNFVGVVNATLSLNQISQFLSQLTVGETGQVFIIDREGRLIATPTGQVADESGQERLAAIASPDPMIREVADVLQTRYGPFGAMTNQQLTARINQQMLSIQVYSFRDGRGLDWLVVIVVPQSDFTADIVASTRLTVLLCLLALGVAIAISIAISQWLLAPISRLVRAATALAQGDWQQEVDTQRSDELGTLALAFDEMRSQLKQAQRNLEHKIAERTQELQESEEKFSKAFRLSPEPLAIASYTSECIIIDVNDSFLALSGYSRSEVLGKSGDDLNIWARPQDREDAIRQIETHGMARNLEIQYRTKSGQIRNVLFSAEVIDLHGESCLLCVLSDVTEMKQAAILLQEAKTVAEQANRAKSTFLANMSHELRTPLNAILGFTQLMQRNAAYADAASELNIISRSGEHLLSLINDILDMSKIEAGQTTLDVAPFDLEALLNTLEAMLRLRANSKGLLLTFDRHPAVPSYIAGDEQKLRQVLINLLGNAIKFTDRGSVSLRVRVLDRDSRPIWTWGAEGLDRDPRDSSQGTTDPHGTMTLEFTIADTGPGIAAVDVAHLFDPFVQTSEGRRSRQGTGLGLTISQTFVQLMGGTIEVESVLGEGSCFQFTIQAQRASAADIQPSQPQRRVIGLAPHQPQYRMLIVDEVPENRLLLRKLLEPAGFELWEARNGQEAIAQWQTLKPHLIWMDMRMPVMDGYEATRLIKATPDGKQTVIIALTASALSQDREKILTIGCDDFIRKPFRESEIWDAIARHLSVQYLYDEDQVPHVPSPAATTVLQSKDLQVMPQAWIDRLHQAALSGDDALAMALVKEIPATHDTLIAILVDLIHRLRLDTISDATQAIASPMGDIHT
jgi:PAS domain S-box-containing protein